MLLTKTPLQIKKFDKWIVVLTQKFIQIYSKRFQLLNEIELTEHQTCFCMDHDVIIIYDQKRGIFVYNHDKIGQSGFNMTLSRTQNDFKIKPRAISSMDICQKNLIIAGNQVVTVFKLLENELQLLYSINENLGVIRAVQFVEEYRLLVSMCSKVILFINMESGVVLKRIQPHSNITCGFVEQQSGLFTSGGADTLVKIWKMW